MNETTFLPHAVPTFLTTFGTRSCSTKHTLLRRELGITVLMIISEPSRREDFSLRVGCIRASDQCSVPTRLQVARQWLESCSGGVAFLVCSCTSSIRSLSTRPLQGGSTEGNDSVLPWRSEESSRVMRMRPCRSTHEEVHRRCKGRKWESCVRSEAREDGSSERCDMECWAAFDCQ